MRSIVLLATLFVALVSTSARAAEPIVATGMLSPKEEVQIGTEVRGTIMWMADEGSVVAKGQPLVKLRDVLEKLEVDLRRAQLEGAKCAVERYLKDFEAAKKLHADKVVNDEELRAKELNYRTAISQHAQTDAMLKSALENVEMKIIRSPTNCVVQRHFKKPGEVLLVSEAVENILKVVHLDSLYMIAYPDARYVEQIRVGQKAEVRLPLYGDRKLKGEVVFVDPVVDAASGGFRIKVLIPNLDHKIKAGLHGTVTILPDVANAAAK